MALYRAAMEAEGREAVDHAGRVAAFPPARLDFGLLVGRAGLPAGPRLQRFKLALRQAEVEGRVGGEEHALALLQRLARSGPE
jgi:hypothetical protein